MRFSNAMIMVAAVALIAGCSRQGDEVPAEANNSIANVAEEAPEPEAKAAEEERRDEEERADRPLADFASFELAEAERERRLSRTYNGCMDEAASTADYRRCSSDEFRRIEREMERALDRAQEGMGASGRERFGADQRRWRGALPDLCRRELEEEGAEGGSMDLLTLDACSLRELIRRTVWLETLSER